MSETDNDRKSFPSDDEPDQSRDRPAPVPVKGQSKLDPGRRDGPPADDPLDIKRSANGIGVLIVVCGILWALSKFGPEAADALGNWTKTMVGLEDTQPEKAEPATVAAVSESKPEPVKADKSEDAAKPPSVLFGKSKSVAPVVPAAPTSIAGNSANLKILRAREQITAALGGDDKALVQHVAISKDEESMVAAVKMTNPDDNTSKSIEIFFELDDFGRYVTTADSPVDQQIKIWTQE